LEKKKKEREEKKMSVKMKLGLLVFGTIGSMLLEFVSCKTVHIVGDQLGWNIPTQQTFYDDWAKKKAFVVGDQLGTSFTIFFKLFIIYLLVKYIFVSLFQLILELIFSFKILY